MTNPHNHARTARAALLVLPLAACLLAPGCGEKKEEAAPPPPVSAPPPPPPDPLENVKLDPRVEFPPERAPTNPALAEAVAAISNAIVKSDHAALRPLLARRDQSVLDDLVARGDWKLETERLERVRVCTLTTEEGMVKLALGLQNADGADLIAFEGSDSGGSWVFTGLAIEPAMARTAKDLDGVELKIRNVVVAAADKPAEAPKAEKPKEETGEESSDEGTSQPAAIP